MVSPVVLAVSLLSLSVQYATAQRCLSDQAAQQVAQNFAGLFSRFTPQYADSVLAHNFIDQSDSVNWLMSNGTGCPKQLGELTEINRANFERDEATQQNMPFLVENVYHDCTNVFVRWKFAIQPQQVQGIAILGTVCNKGFNNGSQPYLIQHVFSEFNTGAFLYNLGNYRGTPPPACTNPGASKRDMLSQAMPWRG